MTRKEIPLKRLRPAASLLSGLLLSLSLPTLSSAAPALETAAAAAPAPVTAGPGADGPDLSYANRTPPPPACRTGRAWASGAASSCPVTAT
jgi:hypothetical protein